MDDGPKSIPTIIERQRQLEDDARKLVQQSYSAPDRALVWPNDPSWSASLLQLTQMRPASRGF